MSKLITVKRAKEEIERLQHYVDLAEQFEARTLEMLIIKEYAYTNSILRIVNLMSQRGYEMNGKPIDRQMVTNIIKSKPHPTDELHKILKTGYMKRTKHTRISHPTKYTYK